MAIIIFMGVIIGVLMLIGHIGTKGMDIHDLRRDDSHDDFLGGGF